MNGAVENTSQIEASVMFADIVSSTSLFELLGETHARETINFCLQMMRRAVLDHRGTVIKTIGDELMSVFKDPNDALYAAQQMHEDITETLTVRDRSITLRIGAHQGIVTRERNDVTGAAVHLAARMASQAKSGQVVISEQMREQLSGLWASSTRKLDEVKAEGFSELVSIYEILWKDEGVTSVVPILDQAAFGLAEPKRLMLQYGDKQIFVDNENQVINLGRAMENEISMNHDLVSRVHARIEWNKDKFRIQDRSTNGSYIRPLQGQPVFVRRDYSTLTGKGIIGLGQDVDIKSPYAIKYQILD